MEVLWWQIPTTVVTTIVTTVLLRYVTLGRARISSAAAGIAREALTAAAWVFGQSSSCGGQLRHPWQLPSGAIHWHELESKLTDAHDRITDREFRATVVAIRAELQGIWASQATHSPGIWYEGKVPLPSELEHEKELAARKERQRLHAQRGEELIVSARVSLERLARRA
jgi:hypothetical protein